MDQPSIIKTYSQSQRPEDWKLWELAFEYPPLYEAIESVWLQSPEFTDQDILNSVNIAYQKAEEAFEKIAFERILKERFGDNFDEIMRLLTGTHGSTFTPKRVSLGREFISDERQLELIVLNIVAGAIVAYDYPEIHTREGEKSGALIQKYPSDKVINLSRKLYKAIQEERLWTGDFKNSLWELSDGQPLETQLLALQKPKAKLERLVKEITLLSERYLTMRTKGQGRFPTSAIIEITKIVQHFPPPDKRTISPIQKKYAKKNKEDPLATKWSSV
ncbi:hypothetical protein N9W15_05945 [Porticoccaceae bacterium]|nr:hypothetical protein [Porticoccaceae bacterium]MDA7696564.1 hypothetical protein [Porticoccaceae bacterium]MDB2394598.1 hypothetical protein [Porticoccaceae bacterium]MDB2400934.1 hypothetical protein [Porticoccaceae bacterium]